MNRFNFIYFKISLFIVLSFCSIQTSVFAQETLSLMRKGNAEIKKGNAAEAEILYRKALDKTPNSPDILYNLGIASYLQLDSVLTAKDNLDTLTGMAKLGRMIQKTQQLTEPEKDLLNNASSYFEKSIESFQSARDKENGQFNLAGTFLRQGKYDEAESEYKKILRSNPGNMAAKDNLFIAQQLKQQQQQDKDKDKDNKDKKDDKQQDKKDKDKENPDGDQDKENQDKEKQDKKDNKDNQDKDDKQQESKPQNISKEDAQKILNAMQQKENQTQDKLDKKPATPIKGASGKNW